MSQSKSHPGAGCVSSISVSIPLPTPPLFTDAGNLKPSSSSSSSSASKSSRMEAQTRSRPSHQSNCSCFKSCSKVQPHVTSKQNGGSFRTSTPLLSPSPLERPLVTSADDDLNEEIHRSMGDIEIGSVLDPERSSYLNRLEHNAVRRQQEVSSELMHSWANSFITMHL